MPSINLIKASDGTGNASTASVLAARTPPATAIVVDTVNNIPANFIGTWGTPHTFTDPVTNEEITVVSESTAVDFTGHVDGANLEIDSIAPGYTDGGNAQNDIIVIRPNTLWADNIAALLDVSHNDNGTIKNGAITLGMLSTALLNNIYPVGSIYTNATVSTNPATLLGFGTWVAFGEGRVPVGKAAAGTFATAGATGGAETHTLTTAEMPAHTHSVNKPLQIPDTDRGGASSSWSLDNVDYGATSSTGGGGAHNNLQPYVVVYMWKRTA